MSKIEIQDWNERGLSYGWMMVCLYFGVAVLVWLAYSWVFNQFIVMAINPQIELGEMSVQSVNAVKWNIDVFRYAPPIFLIFGFIWAVNRAIFKRSTG